MCEPENGLNGLFVPVRPSHKMRVVSWEENARCRSHDPEMFFAPGIRTERKAKAICGRCPVQQECLRFALASRTEFGIWGGLNGKERRRVLRRFAATNDWRPDLIYIPEKTLVTV
jgi:WhiB family transcriptional regulator, redox-sensing transcriptional regulator